jgi:hypothetical protein
METDKIILFKKFDRVEVVTTLQEGKQGKNNPLNIKRVHLALVL